MVLQWLRDKDGTFSACFITIFLIALFLIFLFSALEMQSSENTYTFFRSTLVACLISFLYAFFCMMAYSSIVESFSSFFGGMLGCLFACLLYISFASFFVESMCIFPWQALLVLTLIMMELFYWIDEEKPKKKENKFWFTVYKKVDSLLNAFFTLAIIQIIRVVAYYINFEILLKIFHYIGIALSYVAGAIFIAAVAIGTVFIAVLVLYLFIKLNQIKYGFGDKKTKTKKKR